MGPSNQTDIRQQIRHLIRPPNGMRLALPALKAQVRWWIERHSPLEPQAWVLQPSLRGPVWRLERYIDQHKDILAVAILRTLHELDSGEAPGVEGITVESETRATASLLTDAASTAIRRTLGRPSLEGFA